LELAPLIVHDLQHGGLGQHPLLTRSGIDPGHGPPGRMHEHAVTDGIAQPGRHRHLMRRLPGAGRGDLSAAVGFVLDPLPSHRHGAKDRLEGERGGAAADDPLALLPLTPGQDELAIGLLDGLLEQAALEVLPTGLEGGLQVLGQVGVWVGQGQFEGHLSPESQVAGLDLDWFEGDRSLMSLRSTHGEVLLCRGGVAMRALLLNSAQILQIRAQTGDRQDFFSGRGNPRLTFEAPSIGRAGPLAPCSRPSTAPTTVGLSTDFRPAEIRATSFKVE
jgi:hypothetical protein